MTRPMTYTLLVLFACLAVVAPLIPEPFRPLNFALFGALGLFASGRIGFWTGLAVCLGCKAGSDVINYFAQHQNAWYLPIPEYIACFAVYPLAGRLLRKTDHPLAVAGTAVLGSLLFFLLSNFGSWCQPSSLYGYKSNGLLKCYEMGLPFLRFSVISDLVFSVSVFALHSILAEHYFPVEKAIRLAAVDPGARR